MYCMRTGLLDPILLKTLWPRRRVAPFAASPKQEQWLQESSHPWWDNSQFGSRGSCVLIPVPDVRACSSLSLTRWLQIRRLAPAGDKKHSVPLQTPWIPAAAVLISMLAFRPPARLSVTDFILLVPWHKGGNRLPRSTQCDPRGEWCVSLEQGEAAWPSRQMLPALPPVSREKQRASADINSEAFPNPQSDFDNKEQVTLLSETDTVHLVTKRGQHRWNALQEAAPAKCCEERSQQAVKSRRLDRGEYVPKAEPLGVIWINEKSNRCPEIACTAQTPRLEGF